MCDEITLYLQSILYELGLECDEPTPIYKNIVSSILIINSTAPTKLSQHIYIQ